MTKEEQSKRQIVYLKQRHQNLYQEVNYNYQTVKQMFEKTEQI